MGRRKHARRNLAAHISVVIGPGPQIARKSLKKFIVNQPLDVSDLRGSFVMVPSASVAVPNHSDPEYGGKIIVRFTSTLNVMPGRMFSVG